MVAFATGALSLLAGGLGLSGVVKLIKRRKTIYQLLLAVPICLIGFVLSWIHLAFFDPAYLRRGKLSA